jgi:hypothetical protein
MMRHNRETVLRFAVDSSALTELDLEPCGHDIWVSRTCCCTRHNLIGVSARQIDVLVQHGIDADHGLICVEVSRKAGKFDAAIRDRLCFRRIVPGLETLGDAVLAVERRGKVLTVALRIGDDTAWSGDYALLRAAAAPTGVRDLVMWHWSRYFRHLAASTAEQVAERLVIVEGTTITAANRLASNMLYEESTATGWRKLTLRERERLSLDGGQWHREETVLAARARYLATRHSPTGAGEYTLCAAAGHS